MAQPKPKLQRIPQDIAAVADYEAYARERLTPQAWAYFAGAGADGLTQTRNRAAFDALCLRGRVLGDLGGGHTRLTLLGQTLESPILLAPVAFQKMAHPDGELGTVAAASAFGAAMVVSTQASVDLEEIARQAQTPLWFQLYIQPDRGFTQELVRRAEAAGYRALVVTVDAPVNGMRNDEQRAGFVLPPGVEAVNLRGMRPGPGDDGSGRLLGGPLLAAAPTWKDIAWLKSLTRLPVLIKGVMTAEDATRALAEGVDGVVVSNHGGRVLDSQPATIEVLPEIAAALEGRLPILLDGGIRRGTDVLKALALGANAVLIGRAYLFALAAAGAVGVAHVIRMLRAELEVAMALTGYSTLNVITPSGLWR